MPVRRLAAAFALAALGSLLAAQAAMAQAGGGGGAIDPEHAIGQVRLWIIAIGVTGFTALAIPALLLIWKHKYELAIMLMLFSFVPGFFIFAGAFMPSLVRGIAQGLAQ